MEYSIKLYHDKQLFQEIKLVGNATLLELIDFLIENFPKKFKKSDRHRIQVKSRFFDKQLKPEYSLEQILGKMKGDTFDIEMNQQSQINENKEFKQNIQVEQNQQNWNQQSINLQQFQLTFKYKQDQISCELNGGTTLADVSKFIKDHFKIQEQFNLICNTVNLSEMSQQTQLSSLKLQNNMIINVISQIDDQNSDLVKIQFNIEDGIIKRSCVLNCSLNQLLGDIKVGVLLFLGINSFDIADIDLFFGKTLMCGKKLNETLKSLQITKDYTTVIAKVRWIGG